MVIWLLLLVTFILCNFYATLTVCALHYSYITVTFKANELYFQVIGVICYRQLSAYTTRFLEFANQG